MKNIKKHVKNFLKDESGQGTTEYILILVAIVGVVTFFGKDITAILRGKVSTLGTAITNFNPSP